MKTEIVVLKGLKEITRIKGEISVKVDSLSKEEIGTELALEQIPLVESLLEKLTGFRFHILSVEE